MTAPAAVGNEPPAGLVAAQRMAIAVAEQLAAEAAPGQTEIELYDRAAEVLEAAGSVDTWTATNVGFGAGTLSCFPTDVPSSRPLWNIDVGFVDVHPVTADGWWGDCTRTFVRGDNPRYAQALAEIHRIQEVTNAAARPGMRACDLFFAFDVALAGTGFQLLDRLNNIGHSLGEGTSYDLGYLDPWNQTELRGAWAVEPFVGNHLFGVKLEDVIWFGTDTCEVVR
jgi:Xaa-Pro dipeptidase